MKKLITLLLIAAFFMSLGLNATVNGKLSQIGNKYVLHVWGTHYERGYATGYLMGTNIMNVFSNYFYTSIAHSNPATYNNLHQYFQDHFVIDSRYQYEAQGMIDGILAAGVSPYHSGIGRDLYVSDLLFVTAVVDIYALARNPEWEMGCSSLSSWGQATTADPFLQGGVVVTRLLDWSPNSSLIANPVLIVHIPTEPDERKWMSFTYPGMFGALSAITDNGAAAFLNMGNIHPQLNETGLTPVLLDIRSGLERIDYNGDGIQNTEDLFSSLLDGNHISGTIIHNVQEWPDSCRTAIIETNNSGTVRRLHNQNSGLNGDNLAATNHFRLLNNPVYCARYNRIIDSLSVSPIVNPARQWKLLQGAGGVSSNLMMMQYEPTTGNILWSVAIPSHPAYTQTPLELNTSTLFVIPTGVNDENLPPAAIALKLYPNPLHNGDKLRLSCSKQIFAVEVYNLRGQLLSQVKVLALEPEIITEQLLSNQPSGVYLLKAMLNDGSTLRSKMLYIKS
jgi:hypothetical protein